MQMIRSGLPRLFVFAESHPLFCFPLYPSIHATSADKTGSGRRTIEQQIGLQYIGYNLICIAFSIPACAFGARLQ